MGFRRESSCDPPAPKRHCKKPSLVSKRGKKCKTPQTKICSFVSYLEQEHQRTLEREARRLCLAEILKTKEDSALQREYRELSDFVSEAEFLRIVGYLQKEWDKQDAPTLRDEEKIQILRQICFPRECLPELSFVDVSRCPKCGDEFMKAVDEAIFICGKCALSHVFVDTSLSSLAYGNEIDFVSFSYKRLNHLCERLNHVQAKELVPVNANILRMVMEVLFEKGLREPSAVTFRKVILCMKKLKLDTKNAMQVWCRITGNLPIVIGQHVEEKMRLMFIRIQEPFDRHRPPHRKNFLSYSYCLFKFCQILGEHTLLPYFPLLKGADKLLTQEVIFELICKDVGWTFRRIPFQYVVDEDTQQQFDALFHTMSEDDKRQFPEPYLYLKFSLILGFDKLIPFIEFDGSMMAHYDVQFSKLCPKYKWPYVEYSPLVHSLLRKITFDNQKQKKKA